MTICFPFHGKAMIYPVPITPAWFLAVNGKGRGYEFKDKLNGIYQEEANDKCFLVLLPMNGFMVDILSRKDSTLPYKDKWANS